MSWPFSTLKEVKKMRRKSTKKEIHILITLETIMYYNGILVCQNGFTIS